MPHCHSQTLQTKNYMDVTSKGGVAPYLGSWRQTFARVLGGERSEPGRKPATICRMCLNVPADLSTGYPQLI
jgi:hypothetical protein